MTTHKKMLNTYCMKSATTATTTPSRADAAFLLLPLLLVLVLLGCCFVCTPWPANKDCGPVVVVTGGVSTTKGKNEKNQKYTSSGTGCQIRLQASQNKTNPCMLHGAAVFVSTNNKKKKKKNI